MKKVIKRSKTICAYGISSRVQDKMDAEYHSADDDEEEDGLSVSSRARIKMDAEHHIDEKEEQ